MMNKGSVWYDILKNEFRREYMLRLSLYLEVRRTQVVVYPDSEDVFKAYDLTLFENVKVCIIGQDPYIRKDEAHGLSFSTKSGKGTPSLRQIEKAVRSEMNYDKTYVWNNNLTRWAEQGVFLLNTVLTVDAGASNSHAGKGWEEFTLRTIEELDKKGDVIFLLWGKAAQSYDLYIKNSKAFKCEHPVAASYQGRLWDNGNCFSKVNELLTNKINW